MGRLALLLLLGLVQPASAAVQAEVPPVRVLISYQHMGWDMIEENFVLERVASRQDYTLQGSYEDRNGGRKRVHRDVDVAAVTALVDAVREPAWDRGRGVRGVAARYRRGQLIPSGDWETFPPNGCSRAARRLVGAQYVKNKGVSALVDGELYAVNVDGKYSMLLASPYGVREHPGLVTEVRNTFEQSVYMLDPLAADPRNVLISAVPVASDPVVRIEKLDIYSRNRVRIAEVPVQRASFVSDQTGEVRFAVGAKTDNVSKLFYREARGQDWRLINDEGSSGHRRFPLGFSADGKLAYLQVEHASGPDSIVSWDPASGAEVELLRDPLVDPYHILYDLDGKTPIGASYMNERVSNRFFDETARTARFYRSLEKVFVNDAVRMTSSTSDGRYVLLFVWSDRNNGDYFLFDTQERKADRMFSRREWFAPQQVPPSRYISFRARDGMQLHGYLTEPLKPANGPRPMVLLPHGGPFTIFDQWRFDDDAQLLAAAGYAVLRVNYRGSGNYGRAYTEAGSREWGARMQDDLADATRWAINEGVADRQRICIYGASYGGYAALMGAARDPDLYRCAAGYVGVYDLELMHRNTSQRSQSGRTWAGEWLGERSDLGARSPVLLADRIKVPVFLAAGGKDERAPLEHSKRMERALKNAGVPVETLYYPNEGHGFYTEPHRREYYARLLSFLSQHLGGAKAKPGSESGIRSSAN